MRRLFPLLLALPLACGETEADAGETEADADGDTGDTGDTGGSGRAECPPGQWSVVDHPDVPPVRLVDAEGEVIVMLHHDGLSWSTPDGQRLESSALPPEIDTEQVLGLRALGDGVALLVFKDRILRWEDGALAEELALDSPGSFRWSDGSVAVGGTALGGAIWRRAEDGTWSESSAPAGALDLVHYTRWTDGTEAVIDAEQVHLREPGASSWVSQPGIDQGLRIAAVGDPPALVAQNHAGLFHQSPEQPGVWNPAPLPEGLETFPPSLWRGGLVNAGEDMGELHVLRWNGAGWEDQEPGLGLVFEFTSFDDPFVAGDRFLLGGAGQLWRLDGGLLQPVVAEDNLCGSLLGVDGEWGHALIGSYAPLLRFDGERWFAVVAATQVVEFGARQDGSAIAIDSSGQLFHAQPDGARETLPFPPELFSADWVVWTDDADRTWVFGGGFDMQRRVCPWSDGQWGTCVEASAELELKTFPIVARGALGMGDDSGLSFFDGAEWSRVPQPEPPLVGAGVSSVVWQDPDSVWISDFGRLTRWDGIAWAEVTDAPAGDLAPDGDVGLWLVSHDDGALWHFDGEAWEPIDEGRFAGAGWQGTELRSDGVGRVTVFTCDTTETYECG